MTNDFALYSCIYMTVYSYLIMYSLSIIDTIAY